MRDYFQPFPARLTADTVTSGGLTAFGWTEQVPTTSGYLTPPGARTGHPYSGYLASPCYEINAGTGYVSGTVVILRQRGVIDGGVVWEFAHPITSGSSAQTWRDSVVSGNLTGGNLVGSSGLAAKLFRVLNSGGSTALDLGSPYAELQTVDYLPTQNRWKGLVDSEIILFEGTSGGVLIDALSGGPSFQVSIAQRAVDGTSEDNHQADSDVIQQVPDTTFRVGTVTFEKNQFVYPGSGNGVNVVPQVQTVRVLSASGITIRGIAHYSGRVELYDWTQNSGGKWVPLELCWAVERNTLPPLSGQRYDGTLAGYSASGVVSPIYLVDQRFSGTGAGTAYILTVVYYSGSPVVSGVTQITVRPNESLLVSGGGLLLTSGPNAGGASLGISYTGSGVAGIVAGTPAIADQVMGRGRKVFYDGVKIAPISGGQIGFYQDTHIQFTGSGSTADFMDRLVWGGGKNCTRYFGTTDNEWGDISVISGQNSLNVIGSGGRYIGIVNGFSGEPRFYCQGSIGTYGVYGDFNRVRVAGGIVVSGVLTSGAIINVSGTLSSGQQQGTVTFRQGFASDAIPTNLQEGEPGWDVDTKTLYIGTSGNNVSRVGESLPSQSVPISPSAAGTAGQVAYTSGWLYFCTGTNVWGRVSLSGF